MQSIPAAAVSLGDQAVEFAAKAGLFLDPWQQDVLRGSLGLLPGGKWAARNVGLLVPRQNGKGSVLEALELFCMFVLDVPLIIHSAHRFDTSQEHFLRMRNLIDGNDDLAKHVKSVYTANGKEAIELKNGCRLKFKARTLAGSGRGFSCDLLVLDEAMLLPEQALAAMGPAQSARKNPQTWFTSSAGTPDSAALWRLVKQGRSRAKRLAYFEWGCESGVDVEDGSQWALANPGLGYRLSVDELENELGLLTPEDFAREHLGIWDDQATVSLFPDGAWDALADPESKITGPVTFAVEVAADREKWACIGCAGMGEKAIHVGSVDYRQGTAWILARAKELAAEKPGSAFAMQRSSPAGSLIADFEAAGLTVIDMSQQDYAQGCGDFTDAVINSEIRHLGQPELDMSVVGAKKKPAGDGAYVWDRRKSLDITPLAAATLALRGHVSRPALTPTIW